MKNKKKIKILEKRIEVIESWLITLSTFLQEQQNYQSSDDLEDENGIEINQSLNNEEE